MMVGTRGEARRRWVPSRCRPANASRQPPGVESLLSELYPALAAVVIAKSAARTRQASDSSGFSCRATAHVHRPVAFRRSFPGAASEQHPGDRLPRASPTRSDAVERRWLSCIRLPKGLSRTLELSNSRTLELLNSRIPEWRSAAAALPNRRTAEPLSAWADWQHRRQQLSF